PSPRPAEIRNPEGRHSDRQAEPRRPEPRLAEARVPEPRALEPAGSGEKKAEPETTVAVSAAAIERLRSTMVQPPEVGSLSPNGSEPGSEVTPISNAVEMGAETAVVDSVPRSASAGEGGKEARLEFLFRPRPARRAPQESFDAMWPKRAAQGGGSQP